MSSGNQYQEARSVTTVRDLPIGIQASGTRQESDSMGTIAVRQITTGGRRRSAL